MLANLREFSTQGDTFSQSAKGDSLIMKCDREHEVTVD